MSFDMMSLTVFDVLTKAQKKQLAQSRVPKMCLLLDSIDDSTASAVFTDLTGSMHGSIHQQVLKHHQIHLISGSVFVLPDTGSTSEHKIKKK